MFILELFEDGYAYAGDEIEQRLCAYVTPLQDGTLGTRPTQEPLEERVGRVASADIGGDDTP